MQYELQLIISGKSEVKYGFTIQVAKSYLELSQNKSKMDKGFKQFKE